MVNTARQCVVMAILILTAYSVYSTAVTHILSPFSLITNILTLVIVSICDEKHRLFSHIPCTRLAMIYTLTFSNGITLGRLVTSVRDMYNR